MLSKLFNKLLSLAGANLPMPLSQPVNQSGLQSNSQAVRLSASDAVIHIYHSVSAFVELHNLLLNCLGNGSVHALCFVCHNSIDSWQHYIRNAQHVYRRQ